MLHAKQATGNRAPARWTLSGAEWPKRGFLSGFMTGFGALAMLGAYEFNPPRYPGEGVGADWRAVGKELRNALRRYDERQGRSRDGRAD